MLERTSVLGSSVLAGIGGALVGVLGTAVQQAVFRIGTTVEIPWGLVLAEAIMVTYLVGIRLRSESRIPVLVAGIALVVVTGVALPVDGGYAGAGVRA